MVLALAAVWALHHRRSKQEQRETGEPPLQQQTIDRSHQSQNRWQVQIRNFETVRDNLLRCYQGPSNVMSDLEVRKQPQVPPSTPSLALSLSNSHPNVFRSVVREEWINAVFGKEFFGTAGYQAPRHGVGLSQIPSYVTYSVRIPAVVDNKNRSNDDEDNMDKLGVTISRIAIGLYVHSVRPGSEAFLAGITENSILVSINGMGILAEPAKQALERMWQYEGFVWDESFEEESPTSLNSSNSSSSEPNPSSNTTSIKDPVTLTLIRDGKLYSVLLLSNPPYGITWGPCGNFALVQRVYSHAAAAGVRRGSLVAAVNGLSMRALDHTSTAETLRDIYAAGGDIDLVLCYTPAAARTGHFEGKSKIVANPPKPKLAASSDGVEVRVHPLEYSITSLWNRAPAQPVRPTRQSNAGGRGGNLGELASRVAAGEELAPTGRGCWMPHRVYGPCPLLPSEQLLSHWDLLVALRCCVSLHNAEYIESKITPEDCTKEITQLIEASKDDDKVAETVSLFLPQLLSAICMENSAEKHSEEKKENSEDDQENITKHIVDQLTSILLRSSRRDKNLGQSLYFLLRSYIATFEANRSIAGEHGSGAPTRNLLALMHCLDLLRSAEQQLVDQISLVAASSSGSERSAHISSQASLEKADDSSTRDTPDPSAGVLVSNKKDLTSRSRRSLDNDSSHVKGKSVMGLFRKKSNKKDIHKRSSAPIVMQLKSGESNSESTRKIASFDNMSNFLKELDTICETIEGSLLKSFSQKIADWALQPWSESKGNALAKVTEMMRDALSKANGSNPRLPFLNPIDSSEILVSVDTKECYILPSAHFPLLIAFNVDTSKKKISSLADSTHYHAGVSAKDEQLYRTKVEIVALRGSVSPRKSSNAGSVPEDRSYLVVHGAVAGMVKESSRSVCSEGKAKTHTWNKGNVLNFETRSCWGAPQTLSLRLSRVTVSGTGQDQVPYADDCGRLQYASEVGYCWIDLRPVWHRATADRKSAETCHATVTCHAQIWSLDGAGAFDENGDMPEGPSLVSERLEIEIRVTAELQPFTEQSNGSRCPKRLLLYKHDDDLRLEMFAIQFINACGSLLLSSGLDLKLLTFRCIPVGPRRGFIEWIPGSVPLSDICQPFAGWLLDDNGDHQISDDASLQSVSGVAKAGLTKYKSLRRVGGNQCNDTRGSFANNPIQDYLRSVAYDPEAPYLIQTEVMSTYIKSCAGYCVITYLLGVGDRHLDNLLLHHSGRFFHCDYSFILGNDPKKYLPVRITEDMIFGLGGRESDNYAKFLSLIGATFLALRQPGNVRFILSLVRTMVPSCLPDLSTAPEDVILGIRERLRLDLSEHAAVSFMEKLIETSLSSKMWLAVDAIHSLGKKF